MFSIRFGPFPAEKIWKYEQSFIDLNAICIITVTAVTEFQGKGWVIENQ